MNDINKKILRALEKFLAALKSQIWDVSQKHRLSPIMIQFLLYIEKQPQKQSTVSHLAQEFSVSKPTVSDAIISLEKKGFIIKKRDKTDGRLKYLNLTAEGRRLINEIEQYERWFITLLDEFPEKTRKSIYLFFIDLLKKLKERGDIEVLKSCLICRNFEKNKFPSSRRPHYCRLLDLKLSDEDIRIDCPSNLPYSSSLSRSPDFSQSLSKKDSGFKALGVRKK